MTARTIARIAELSGRGLHSGAAVRVRIKPGQEGCGIRFVRVDQPGSEPISSRDIDQHCAPFRTGLKKGTAEVHTVEHLLSALAGVGVSDVEIEIDGAELPGLDGSAREYAAALLEAGVVAHGTREIQAIVVDRALRVEDGPASLEALPYEGGLKISYTLHYPGHALAQGRFEFEFSAENYLREIAPARTFAIKPEAQKMLEMGFGKGANTDNTVVIDGGRAIGTELRFADEPVRHKILDMIGDLYVTGRPLRAQLIGKFSGHKANRAMALKLLELYG